MADTKTSALPAASTLDGTELAPVVQGGVSKKATLSAILALLVDAAPGALDTLNELAAALGDDANFATTMTTALAAKVAKSTYDANTILKADTDDTPVALTMAASTILARLASGSIVAATPAQLKTLLAIAEADVTGLVADLAAKVTLNTGAAPNALTGSPTLAAWYKADAITGKVDGDAISQWDDSSGNGLHVAQATGADQPIYKAAASVPWNNAKPTVRFNGTNQFLSKASTGLAAGDTWSIAAVAYKNLANVAVNSMILTTSGVSNLQLAFESRSVAARGGSSTDYVQSGQWGWETGQMVLIVVFDGAQGHLYVNGQLVAYSAISGDVTPSTLFLGARWVSDQFFGGDISEVALYSSALSAAQRDQLTRHLAWKYALPVVPPF